MDEYISRSEECQKAFEAFGGESEIYADAYNDLAEDFYSIPTSDVAPVVRCKDCRKFKTYACRMVASGYDDFCSYGERKEE